MFLAILKISGEFLIFQQDSAQALTISFLAFSLSFLHQMLTDLKILLQAGATMNLQQSAANFH